MSLAIIAQNLPTTLKNSHGKQHQENVGKNAYLVSVRKTWICTNNIMLFLTKNLFSRIKSELGEEVVKNIAEHRRETWK